MDRARLISAEGTSPIAAARRKRWWSLRHASVPTLRHDRTRRVLLMLVLIWVVAIFDLAFTLLARQIGDFSEANPVARQFIESPALLTTFKFATLGLATVIFARFSRYRVTELGCWLIGTVYVALAFVWLLYFV